MISTITKNTKPVCLFACGDSDLFYWASNNPTITDNFSASSTDEVANYQDGLPYTFQTVQSGENTAKKFLIGDFNLIGYLGTLQQFRRQFGGIRTYDSDFATAIGGYPRGIHLDYYIPESNTLRKVLSLIDDNTYNFVTTPAYIDGVHWAYCDEFDPDSPFAGIGSSFKPIDILRYALLEDDFRANDSITVSKTLTTDCWLDVSASAAAKSGTYLTVVATRNGNTKTFFHATATHDNTSYRFDASVNNSMKIVRAGTTVRCTLVAYKAVSMNVSVIAIPASSPIERL